MDFVPARMHPPFRKGGKPHLSVAVGLNIAAYPIKWRDGLASRNAGGVPACRAVPPRAPQITRAEDGLVW